jgi:hypothetical protein
MLVNFIGDIKLAKKVERWQSNDGREFDSELEATQADVEYWKGMYDNLKLELALANKNLTRMSSYGSSGGGGHD